jgi:chitinase
VKLRVLFLTLVTLVVTCGVAQAIAVTWTDNSDSEDGFRIERGTNMFEFEPLVDTPANVCSYHDTDIEPGVSYCYRVRAFTTETVSPPSNIACVQAPRTPDTTPPAVVILSPLAGEIAPKSDIAFTADARDNVAVTHVDLFVNGTLLSTEPTAPYTAQWHVPKKPGRTFTLTARAADAAGNVGDASPVVVRSR